ERSPDLLRDVARLHLVSECGDRLRWRADPCQAGVADGSSEVGVLGQEAVTRVDAVGASTLRDRDDLLDREVRVGGSGAVQRVCLVGEPDELRVAVRLGVNGDARNAGVLACANDTNGDLTTICDQYLGQRSTGLVLAHGRRLLGFGCECTA